MHENTVVFEFYLVSFHQIQESIEQSKLSESSNSIEKPSAENKSYRIDSMDLIWILALRVLQLFEETITSMYPSKEYIEKVLSTDMF